MTLFSDLIEETRLHLLTGQSDRLNQLLSGVTAGATTLQMKFPADGIKEGTTLGIELEEYYVQSASGTTVTVIPGYNGSTPAAHDADDIVRVKPHFSDYRIAKYVNRALEDLSGDGLFRIKQLEFTYQAARAAYDLNAADLIDVWRVKYQVPGPTFIWPDLARNEWSLDQDANTTDFPGGKSLLLQRGGYPGHLVRVSYKAGFAPLTAVGNDVLAVSGLHTEAHKLPPLGAAIYLLGGRDIKRSFLNRQPEPRRQEEVPAGAATQAMRPILLEYMDALRRERRRLRRRYPDSI